MELVRLSQAPERERWLPAVEKLGDLAASDPRLREEIWDRARVNTLGLKFIPIMPGTFSMGPDWHRVFNGPMRPAHPVRITNSFFISAIEVTNVQFQSVFPEFTFDARYSPDADSPAVGVAWEDAVRFCERLSAIEGCVYRLPTEAEWEYTCRAGARTKFWFGDDTSDLGEYGCSIRNANGRACAVAMFRPNDWGIYDMHGNAAEWVSDWFSETYYLMCKAEGTVEDPTPAEGVFRLLRGGAWSAGYLDANSCTARTVRPIFDRFPFDPAAVPIGRVIGFRVVREASGGGP